MTRRRLSTKLALCALPLVLPGFACGDDSASGAGTTAGDSTGTSATPTPTGVPGDSSTATGPASDSSTTGDGSTSTGMGSRDSGSSDGGSTATTETTDSTSSTGTTDSGALEDPTCYSINEGVIPKGSDVTVDGLIITAVHPTMRSGLFFAQHPEGGEYSGCLLNTDGEVAAVGDEVSISGVAQMYGDSMSINATAGTFLVTGSVEPLGPEDVAFATIADPVDSVPWNSVLVRVQGDMDPIEVTAVLPFAEYEASHGGVSLTLDNFIYTGGYQVGATYTAITGNGRGGPEPALAARTLADHEGYMPPP